MLNTEGKMVPDSTIVVFSHIADQSRIRRLLKKTAKKRDWFNPHFYKCLPLSIANGYGFVITNEFDFGVVWNGGNAPNDVQLILPEEYKDINRGMYHSIEAHFGHGIVTINPPFHLRTPVGVNLLTINPPNFVLPNITVMMGSVETDNLRRNFTFNLKIQVPNIEVWFPAGTPLAGFIPVPRYYCDGFTMKFAEEVFDENIIIEELQANKDTETKRIEIEYPSEGKVGLDYFRGHDVYGNKFKDHQMPRG